MSLISIECAHGDHLWRGSGVCSCGARLRCICGQFVTESGMEDHFSTCPALLPICEGLIEDAYAEASERVKL